MKFLLFDFHFDVHIGCNWYWPQSIGIT